MISSSRWFLVLLLVSAQAPVQPVFEGAADGEAIVAVALYDRVVTNTIGIEATPHVIQRWLIRSALAARQADGTITVVLETDHGPSRQASEMSADRLRPVNGLAIVVAPDDSISWLGVFSDFGIVELESASVESTLRRSEGRLDGRLKLSAGCEPFPAAVFDVSLDLKLPDSG